MKKVIIMAFFATILAINAQGQSSKTQVCDCAEPAKKVESSCPPAKEIHLKFDSCSQRITRLKKPSKNIRPGNEDTFS